MPDNDGQNLRQQPAEATCQNNSYVQHPNLDFDLMQSMEQQLKQVSMDNALQPE